MPDHVDLHAVQALLQAQPGVARVHDLHVWAMGTSQVALTAHLVMPHGEADDAFLRRTTELLHEQFEIEHVTLQVVREPFMPGCAVDERPPHHRPHDHDHGHDHGHDPSHRH